LSTETTENKIIISELTTLRLLQDAYIQIVVDTNSRKNNDFSSSIRPVIKPSFSDKNDIMHKEKQVGLDYLKQYIKGLKILGINLTESEYKNFKTIKTQKEFLIFHKSMLFKHKKPLSILKNTNKEAKYSKKSACSVF
jgi:hypothetical protein